MDDIRKKQMMVDIRVGLLFLLVLAVIMIGLFLVKNKTELLEPHYTFHINFPRVNGLKMGAPVQLAGVRIGEVTAIDFTRDLKEQSVLVTVKVRKAVADRVRGDSGIYIDSPSLLSEKNIQITFGTAESPVVKPGDILPGYPEKP